MYLLTLLLGSSCSLHPLGLARVWSLLFVLDVLRLSFENHSHVTLVVVISLRGLDSSEDRLLGE